MPAVVFGLNAAKKSTAPKPTPAKRKAVFDAEEDAASDDEAPACASLASKKSSRLPLNPLRPAAADDSTSTPRPAKSPKLSHAESKVAAVDASVYDYDDAYESFSSAVKKPTSENGNSNSNSNIVGPKYMTNLLASSEQRKRDQLRAREKALLRERDKEGDEFADRDKFVTAAGDVDESKMAKDLNAKGARIVVNDDGDVVDKRQLLSAGLNVAPKPRSEAQRERQTRMMERQLEEMADRAEQVAKAEDTQLQEKNKSRITDEVKMDAKASQ
ncbi:hypothetical protein DV735_g2332, partial [Chaetothyriales sp. CBS 134920]